MDSTGASAAKFRDATDLKGVRVWIHLSGRNVHLPMASVIAAAMTLFTKSVPFGNAPAVF